MPSSFTIDRPRVNRNREACVRTRARKKLIAEGKEIPWQLQLRSMMGNQNAKKL